MTTQNKLVALGEWPLVASAEACGDYAAVALSAANSATAVVSGTGTSQSSATLSTGLAASTYQLVADLANFTTVGTTFNTAQLVNQGGAFQTVVNSGANTVLIYPPLGGTINSLAANAAFGVTTGKSAIFQTPDGLTWFASHAG